MSLLAWLSRKPAEPLSEDTRREIKKAAFAAFLLIL